MLNSFTSLPRQLLERQQLLVLWQLVAAFDDNTGAGRTPESVARLIDVIAYPVSLYPSNLVVGDRKWVEKMN